MPTNNQLALVNNCRSDYTIVVSKKATEVEIFAANELRDYLRKISGVEIPVQKDNYKIGGKLILIGKTQYNCHKDKSAAKKLEDKLELIQEDGFLIQTVDDNLFLRGNTPRGTLFSVYTFLELLGCRWFEPGKLGEVIPKKKTVEIENLDVVEKPDFSIRGLNPVDYIADFTDKDIEEMIDWMAKNRMNIFSTISGPIWGIAPRMSKIKSECRKRDIQLMYLIYMDEFLPPELYEKHPDYFAFIDGERKKGGYCVQRCASNNDAVSLYAQNATTWVKTHPDCILLLTPNDGYGWCQCNGCKKLSPSEQLQVFFNAAKEAIYKVRSKQKIYEYVYTCRYEPPSNIKSSASLNVHFDTFIRCSNHSLISRECRKKHNEKKYDVKIKTKYANRYLSLALKEWRNIADGDVVVFENVALHGFLSTPVPNYHTIAEDASFYKTLGINGIIAESNHPSLSVYWLNFYLIGRLYWNADSNVEKLLADFCQKYYRKAGKSMRDFFITIEKVWSQNDEGNIAHKLSSRTIAQCEKCLRNAQKVINTKETRKRIEKVELYFSYTKSIWLMYQLIHNIKSYQRAKKSKKAKECKDKLVKVLVKLFDNGYSKMPPEAMLSLQNLWGYQAFRLFLPEDKTSNLIQNSGFELGHRYAFLWRYDVDNQMGRILMEDSSEEIYRGHAAYGGNYNGYEIDTKIKHTGKQSIKCKNRSLNDFRGICQTILVNQRKPSSLLLSGWSKAYRVSSATDKDYSLGVCLLYKDGTFSKESIKFEVGTHNWVYEERIINLQKPIKYATVYIVFRQHTGTVWFDDLFLGELQR